jgi:hypothetical protein
LDARINFCPFLTGKILTHPPVIFVGLSFGNQDSPQTRTFSKILLANPSQRQVARKV